MKKTSSFLCHHYQNNKTHRQKSLNIETSNLEKREREREREREFAYELVGSMRASELWRASSEKRWCRERVSGDSLSVKIRARIAESVERRKSKSFHGHTSVTHNQEALNVCVKMFGFYFILFYFSMFRENVFFFRKIWVNSPFFTSY